MNQINFTIKSSVDVKNFSCKGETFGVSLINIEFKQLSISDWETITLVTILIDGNKNFSDSKAELLVLRSRLCSLLCLISHTDAVASDEMSWKDSSSDKITTEVVRGDNEQMKLRSTPFTIDFSSIPIISVEEWRAIDRFGKVFSSSISELNRADALYGTIDILGKVITKTSEVTKRMKSYLKTLNLSQAEIDSIITNRHAKIHENKYIEVCRKDFDLLKNPMRQDLLSRLHLVGKIPLIDTTAGFSVF